MKKIALLQLGILFLGTVNAWINFPNDLTSYMASIYYSGNYDSIIGILLAPCFWGAVLITIATLLSILMLKKDIKDV